jgi:hypothetical protein
MFTFIDRIADDAQPIITFPEIDSISDVLGIAINVLMGVGYALGFVGLAYAFILFITSRGDPKATTKAYNTLKWSVVALLIAFGALAAKAIILGLSGVTDPNLVNELPTF